MKPLFGKKIRVAAIDFCKLNAPTRGAGAGRLDLSRAAVLQEQSNSSNDEYSNADDLKPLVLRGTFGKFSDIVRLFANVFQGAFEVLSESHCW